MTGIKLENGAQTPPAAAPDPHAICAQFAAQMEIRGLSQTDASRAIGVSSGTLSQVLADKYPGNVGNVIAKMARALSRWRDERLAANAPGFQATGVAREVLGVLRRCDVQRVLGMVDGVSGSGKSFALAQYCLGEPGTIVILGTPLSSPRSAIVALANAIGVDDQGSGDVILRKCADALRGTSRLLVLDEADHVSLPVLQTLRIARDAAGIGMVVICTSELLDKLRRRRSGSVEQILSRIAYSCHCAGITDDDAELILSPFGLDRAALRVACASQMHRGSARRVANAYVAAMESVNGSGRKLTALDFQRAYSALMSA